MRLALLAVAGLAAVAVPHLGDASPRPSPALRSSVAVTVHIRCDGDRLASADVRPDPVEMFQGDTLEWRLTDSSDVEDFGIQPQRYPGNAKPWPFADAVAGVRGRRQAPLRGARMRGNAVGRYRYAVVARCGATGGNGGSEVEIDPDIIIRSR